MAFVVHVLYWCLYELACWLARSLACVFPTITRANNNGSNTHEEKQQHHKQTQKASHISDQNMSQGLDRYTAAALILARLLTVMFVFVFNAN